MASCERIVCVVGCAALSAGDASLLEIDPVPNDWTRIFLVIRILCCAESEPLEVRLHCGSGGIENGVVPIVICNYLVTWTRALSGLSCRPTGASALGAFRSPLPCIGISAVAISRCEGST